MIAFLALSAVLIILALSAYALVLTRKVRDQELRKTEVEKLRDQRQKDQAEYLEESLRVIAATALAGDLNYSEAVIRCKMLLEGLNLPEAAAEPYLIIPKVYSEVCHFDTHQARKALSSSERRRQDKAREAIEKKYRAELDACFKILKSFRLP